MKEITVDGTIKNYGEDQWGFESEHRNYSADVCSGIDEIIEGEIKDISNDNEHIKIIIQLLDR